MPEGPVPPHLRSVYPTCFPKVGNILVRRLSGFVVVSIAGRVASLVNLLIGFGSSKDMHQWIVRHSLTRNVLSCGYSSGDFRLGWFTSCEISSYWFAPLFYRGRENNYYPHNNNRFFSSNSRSSFLISSCFFQ